MKKLLKNNFVIVALSTLIIASIILAFNINKVKEAKAVEIDYTAQKYTDIPYGFNVASEDIIFKLLMFQLSDEDKKRKLLPTGAYTRPRITEYSACRSQMASYRFLKELHSAMLSGRGETLKVFASWQTLKNN